MSDAVSLDVVVCTHTRERLPGLRDALDAVVAQRAPGDRVVVVVDGDEVLVAAVRSEVPAGVEVVANQGPRGLSGARNTGVDLTGNPAVVFLDDDAVPRAGWLDSLRFAFDDPRVAMVGGAVTAAWEGGAGAPRWFPEELGWTVGCDYRGLPPDGAAIRNPIGANMAVRRVVFDTVGGFMTELGRRGADGAGCEETELAIRHAAAAPGDRVVRVAAAEVDHFVPRSRQRVAYVLRRCWAEGRSKARLSRRAAIGASLSSEASLLRGTLLPSWGRGLLGPLRGRPADLARAAVSLAGFVAAGVAFVVDGMLARLGSGAEHS